jgi:hypothetical protein
MHSCGPEIAWDLRDKPSRTRPRFRVSNELGVALPSVFKLRAQQGKDVDDGRDYASFGRPWSNLRSSRGHNPA